MIKENRAPVRRLKVEDVPVSQTRIYIEPDRMVITAYHT